MKKKGTRCLHQDTKPLITHPYIFVSSKTTTYIFMRQDDVLFALPNKQTNNVLKQNEDVGMGL